MFSCYIILRELNKRLLTDICQYKGLGEKRITKINKYITTIIKCLWKRISVTIMENRLLKMKMSKKT